MRLSEFSQYRLTLSNRLWYGLCDRLWHSAWCRLGYRLGNRLGNRFESHLWDRITHKLSEVYEDEAE